METKKKNNSVIIIILILFIVFMILYISKESGYYEYKSYKKVTLTNEAIEKFESDVQEGKDINMEDYVIILDKDYSNTFSILGAESGELVNKIMNKFLKNIIKVLAKLFWD